LQQQQQRKAPSNLAAPRSQLPGSLAVTCSRQPEPAAAAGAALAQQLRHSSTALAAGTSAAAPCSKDYSAAPYTVDGVHSKAGCGCMYSCTSIMECLAGQAYLSIIHTSNSSRVVHADTVALIVRMHPPA
jgi:hypothetical protein